MKPDNEFEIYRPDEFNCLVIHGDKNNKLIKELKRSYQPRWKRWWRITRDHLNILADIRDKYGRRSVGEGYYVNGDIPTSVFYVNITGDPSLNRFYQYFQLNEVRYDNKDIYYFQHPITQVNIWCIKGTVPSVVMEKVVEIYEKNKFDLPSGVYEVLGRFYSVKLVYRNTYEVSPTIIDVERKSVIGFTKRERNAVESSPLTKSNLKHMMGFCEDENSIVFWNYDVFSQNRIKWVSEIVVDKKALNKNNFSLSLRRHGRLATIDIVFKDNTPRVEAIKDIILNLSHLDRLEEKGVRVTVVPCSYGDECLLIFGEEYAECVT